MIGGDGVQIGVAMRCDVPYVVLFCDVFTLNWRVVASSLLVFEASQVLLLDARPCMG